MIHHGHHAHDQKDGARIAILTVSNTRAEGDDESGDRIERLVEDAGHEVTARGWVPDEVVPIQTRGLELLDQADALVVTGGTGLAPTDVTPDAFRDLFDRPWPGFGEAFRLASRDHVGDKAWLSRATAGLVRREHGYCPVFLLPGAPDAVELGVRQLILPLLPHILGLVHAAAR